jgi:tetratricopeptide (TPR) repeat protein
LRSAQKYQEAISEYRTYIDLRLKEKTVSENYSPYFYYLLIGEAYLKLDQPDQARTAFLEAKEHGTSPALVADKLRQLAGWYEERKRYDEAIAVLHEFRQLDPLMFDSDLDRNHKEQISAEDRNKNGSDEKRNTY